MAPGHRRRAQGPVLRIEGQRHPLHHFPLLCFNIDERVLNRRKVRTVSGVDLNGVGASQQDIDAGFNALANSELIATGRNKRQRRAGPAGTGVTMVASQFFLPVTPER